MSTETGIERIWLMLFGKKIIGSVAYLGGVMNVPEVFCWSWAQMVQYNTEYLCEPGEVVHYDRATISYHSAARNFLVDHFKGNWLLMLDTDITFEPDLVARLQHRMEKDDLDVLCGVYQHRSPPHSPVLYKWSQDGEHLEALGKWDVPTTDGFYYIPIASAGAGCLMVRRRVYDQIREELHEGPFDILHPLGEDHSFFKRLKRLKVQAYADPSIQVHHLAIKPLTLEDYTTKDLSFGMRQPFEQEVHR